MKIAVTGSSGFVGRALIAFLDINSVDYICIDRIRPNSPLTLGSRHFFLDYSDKHSLISALSGCNVVIHLAGRAHKKCSNSDNPKAQFHNANVTCLQNVVNASVEVGVQRLIFVSSIGVLGSSTNGVPFSDNSPPHPFALYAQSKLKAEQSLVDSLKDRCDIDWVILRPPLIYGENCPGNMAKLIKFVKLLPVVPFASIRARKSFISVKNLVSILYLCAHHSDVSRRSFVVSDCDDISVAEMFRCFLFGLRKSKYRLIKFPMIALSIFSKMLCVSRLYRQVSSELLIDPNGFLSATGWIPIVRCRDELAISASSFR